MDRQELDVKVGEMAKALLSYCSARTSNHFDAEDLAQDIILEIYKSSGNIRNADAVYGFLRRLPRFYVLCLLLPHKGQYIHSEIIVAYNVIAA